MSRDPTPEPEPAGDQPAAAPEAPTEEVEAPTVPTSRNGRPADAQPEEPPIAATDEAAAPTVPTSEAEAPTVPRSPDGPPPPAEAEAEEETEEPPAEEPGADDAAATRRRRLKRIGVPILILAVIGGGYYVWTILHRVKISDSNIIADTTVLSPRGGGKLKQVWASIGDQVEPHRPVAQVGNELIYSDVPGTVVSIRKDLGSYIQAGGTVATLIRRGELRAVGHLKQNKGLNHIRIGQRAVVEVYGYGTRKFPGYVESISQEPQESQLAFSISEKNERPKYDVKVRLLGDPSPLLRQGMDVKIFVYHPWP